MADPLDLTFDRPKVVYRQTPKVSGNGHFGIDELATIAKGVRGHVEYAHDRGPTDGQAK